MENSYQNSTTAQIIDAIIKQLSFEGESKSDIADILLSILNQTPYEKEPSSVIAELFIKLKAKIEGESFEPFDKPYISNIAEIIKSILDETEYNNAPNSRIAELLLELKEQIEEDFTELTASGAIASFITNVSKPLVSCEVDENATKIYHRGKNLFDLSIADKKWVNSSNQIINGTDNTRSNIIPCNEGATITISSQNALGSNNFLLIATLDENGNVISRTVKTSGTPTSLTKTASSSDKAFLVSFYDYTLTGGGMVEAGSSATSYEAYNPLSADYDVADIGNINTFIGVNNIFTDKGDISVSYLYKGQPILTNMLSSNNGGGLLGMDTENNNQEE